MTVIDLLKSDEGFCAHVYKDTRGHLTVGYGRCLDCEGLSEAEAELLLRNDVQHRQIELGKTTWWPKLDAVRQAAFVDMAFQMGTVGVLGFKEVIRRIEAANTWDYVAEALLENPDGTSPNPWAKETPNRARRISEMVRTGLWPSLPT